MPRLLFMSRRLSHRLMVAFALCFLASTTAQALISFGYLSVKQAEEHGLEIRYRASGPDHVGVTVTFDTTGRWAAFEKLSRLNYVELNIEGEDGRPSLRTQLREDRTAKDRVSVSFTVECSQLHQIRVWLTQRITDVADVVRMEDFIPLESIGTDYQYVPPRPVIDQAAEKKDELPSGAPTSTRAK